MKRVTVFAALLCLLFVFQFAFANTPPQAVKDLVYHPGDYQFLITEGIADEGYRYFYRNPYTGQWDTNRPSATSAGTYEAEYILFKIDPSDPDALPDNRKTGTKIKGITIEKSTEELPDGPQARWDLVYSPGDQQYLVEKEGAVGDMTYYFRNRYTGEWETERPEATAVGLYDVEYIIASEKPAKDTEGIFIYNIPIRKSGESVDPTPKPTRTPRPGNSGTGMDWSVIGSTETTVLPATGFSARIHKPLSVQPVTIRFTNLNMRLQIPALDVDVELIGVPQTGNSWAVEWLDDRAGVLSGTFIPGTGTSVVAGHNHLNTTEIGPFGLLFSLEENDRIFVNKEDGGLIIYSVYANELIDPDDMDKLAAIATQEDDSLVLVTCENETSEGGYLNRRAVFARPLF